MGKKKKEHWDVKAERKSSGGRLRLSERTTLVGKDKQQQRGGGGVL